MDQGQFRNMTRRGLARATGMIVSAGALARLEAAELALAKGRGGAGRGDAGPQRRKGGKKPSAKYAMLVYGKASGAIYDELTQTYRMVRYTGMQDPGRYQGVLVDHKHQTQESLARTRLFEDAYAKGIRIFFLDTDPELMRNVHAGQFGGIRSDAMPGFILDRRRVGDNPRGATVGTAWPVTLGQGADGATSVRHAAADRRRGSRAFGEAFALWLASAEEDDRERTARSGTGATAIASAAPQWGSGFVSQTSKQPVTSVAVEAWGNDNLPIYGAGGWSPDGAPECPGYQNDCGDDGDCQQCEDCCFETGVSLFPTDWAISWGTANGESPSTWTSKPLSSDNTVVFIQSVAAGLVPGGGSAPAVPAGSNCPAPPSGNLGDFALWVSAYMSGSPEVDATTSSCYADSTGTVDLCYRTVDGDGTPYCDGDGSAWATGVRTVDGVVGYNMYLGYQSTVAASGGAPAMAFISQYPCAADTSTNVTAGSSHTQGFTIGGSIGFNGETPTATVSAGYSDSWSVSSGTSYAVPDWQASTSQSDGGAITEAQFTVPNGASNYNTWDSYNTCTSCGQLTTGAGALNPLQCGSFAVTGQAYYQGNQTGQGAIDITTNFTYWAGTASNVVDLQAWDSPNPGTTDPRALFQNIAGGSYPISWTLATDSRRINPIQTPTTFGVSWSAPEPLPGEGDQVLQSILTITNLGADEFTYTPYLLLAPVDDSVQPSALDGQWTLLETTVNGSGQNGTVVNAFGVANAVPGGGTLAYTLNFSPLSNTDFTALAMVTTDNPAELAFAVGQRQVGISYQSGAGSRGARRGLKERLARTRRR